MPKAGLLRPPLIALVVAATAIPLAGLLWLGWHLFEKDRQLAIGQAHDRIQQAAEVVIAGLQRSIGASEQRLVAGNDDWPQGALALTFEADRLQSSAPDRLAYLPVPSPLRDVPRHVFEAGEALEFRPGGLRPAIDVYRGQARAQEPAVRAGALLRLARTLAKAGQTDQALEAYGKLAGMRGVSELGFDLGVAAVHERCRLLEREGRTAELYIEATRLERELTGERSAMTASQYFLFAADVERWTGRARAAEREAFAEAAAILWHDWRTGAARRDQPARRTLDVTRGRLVVLWQPTATGARALLATPAFASTEWLDPAFRLATDQHVALTIRDPDSSLHANQGGAAPLVDAGLLPGGLSAERSHVQAELPWNVLVTSTDTAGDQGFAFRWRLLTTGFLLLVSIAVGASALVLRTVRREMAVARLQSDFVAAVSHEFRTPLTTLRQFTEMLREQPHLDQERRALCYDAQARATDRLTRLVESVLDFGRMEAGAQPYRFELQDGAGLVRRVVDDFRGEPQASDWTIAYTGGEAAPLTCDSDALARVAWNLLDNAVKYSLPSTGALGRPRG
jgi:signal transduction histidine kinase